MWGSLGDIVFSLLKAPETIEIEEKAKFAKISIFKSKEKLHFTGLEANSIRLSIFFDISFCNPKEEIEKIRQLKNEAKAENLTIGDINYGKFVIQDFKTSIIKTFPNGQIMSARLEITLIEAYDGD